MPMSFRARRLGLVAAPLLLAALAGCAQTFDAKVSRFQSQLPAPQGQTFAVVPADPRNAGGIEFGQYASRVTAYMLRQGYAQAAGPDSADLIVRFGYGVDRGRERVRSTGFGDPYWGSWYGPGWRHGFGGWGYPGYWGRPGFYRHGAWGYGWYDPFFNDGVEVVTVYTSGIDLEIDRRADGKRLFEGKAEAASQSNNMAYLVPNLIEAMFTGFPGNSGETVRISVAPEKTRR